MALPFLRLPNSVVVIVGMLCIRCCSNWNGELYHNLTTAIVVGVVCVSLCVWKKNTDTFIFLSYLRISLWSFMIIVKRERERKRERKRSKNIFLHIFLCEKNCTLNTIWCEIGAPGFIIALYITINTLLSMWMFFFLFYIKSVYMMNVCEFLLGFWALCATSSTCSAQFSFISFIILSNFLAIVGTDVRIYTFHWAECTETVSRRSRCNYFCVVHFFVCSLLSLLFKLSYHSQVLLLKTLFFRCYCCWYCYLALKLSIDICYFHMWTFSAIAIQFDGIWFDMKKKKRNKIVGEIFVWNVWDKEDFQPI